MIKCKHEISTKLIILLLCLISTIALFIRIQYINHTDVYKPIRADARQYVLYGYNLAHHGIFSKQIPSSNTPSPDSFRSPGYPLLIALSFLLGGDIGFYPIVIYTQIILSVLLVPLTFYLGIRFLPLWGATAAACLVAFSPHLISMTSYLLTETLFAFIFITAIICFYHAIKRQHVFLFIFAGFLFGYAYLTNETVLFIPFLLAIIGLFTNGFRSKKIMEKQLLLKVSLFLFVFSLFPGGWALYNINLPHDAPKGSSRAIATLSHGAYPDFIYKDPRFKYFPYREDPMQPAFGSSLDNFKKIFWTRFKERPGRYLRWYLLEKPYYLWSWNILQGQGDVYVYPVITSLYKSSEIANATRESMKHLHPLILILAIAGIPLLYITYWRGKGAVNIPDTPIILFIICIYFTLLYTIFAPWPRYSIPLRPILYLVALWSLQAGGKFISEKWKIPKHR